MPAPFLLILAPCCCFAQVHDFWHVLTGCHTNVFGELALKALEFVQVTILNAPWLVLACYILAWAL